METTAMSPGRGGRGENVSTEKGYRNPFFGLPVMHVLVVTHLFGCVEIAIIAFFLSWHEGD